MIRRIEPTETFIAIWSDGDAQAYPTISDMAASLFGETNMPTRFIHLLEDGKTQRDCTADFEEAIEEIEQDMLEEYAHANSLRSPEATGRV